MWRQNRKPTLDRTGGRGPYPGDDVMREEQARAYQRMKARYDIDPHKNCDETIERLEKEIKELHELLVAAVDLIDTPFYDVMSHQIDMRNRIDNKLREMERKGDVLR